MEEGFAGIYAGLRPTLVMAIPNTVLYFSAYEEIVWRLREQSNSPAQFWIPLTAGGSARLLASSFTAPFEYLRTRQASMIGQNQPAASMWKELRIIVKSKGIGALYRGLGPTLYRDVPFSAIYWLSLETLRQKWGERTIVTPSPPANVAESRVAAGSSWAGERGSRGGEGLLGITERGVVLAELL